MNDRGSVSVLALGLVGVVALAFVVLVDATSAFVQRRRQAPGGPAAALVVLVGPAFLQGVVFRDVPIFPSLVPGQDLRERWIWLMLAAAACVVFTSRDPAGPQRPRINSRTRSGLSVISAASSSSSGSNFARVSDGKSRQKERNRASSEAVICFTAALPWND